MKRVRMEITKQGGLEWIINTAFIIMNERRRTVEISRDVIKGKGMGYARWPDPQRLTDNF